MKSSDLERMFLAVEREGGVFQPSEFWRELGDEQAEQLEQAGGVANVKRTLAHRYFTWICGIRSDLFWALAPKMRPADWKAVLRDLPEWSSAVGMSRWRWLNQCIYTRMLARYARRIDRLNLLETIAEPAFGNPYPIHLEGRLISQDLINSVLELYAMFEGREIDRAAPLRILEIGAGYGRNAFLFLSAFPNCRYTIVDIPPALYVSRTYLGRVCPGGRVTTLLPHEAEALPIASFDLALNISSFHEMTPAQVDAYFGLIDQKVRGRLYAKQWRSWHNPVDNIDMTEASYPWRPGWRKVYSRPVPTQPSFFEALFEVKPAPVSLLARGPG